MAEFCIKLHCCFAAITFQFILLFNFIRDLFFFRTVIFHVLCVLFLVKVCQGAILVPRITAVESSINCFGGHDVIVQELLTRVQFYEGVVTF